MADTPRKALILAAGIGQRLGEAGGGGPKCLLEVGGRSLLARQLEQLAACGIEQVVLATGHQAGLIEQALDQIDTTLDITLVHNPAYTEGSVVSLWTLREHLASGEALLLMDADVLAHTEILRRLTSTVLPNCFLLDRDFEPGEEPVKLCLRGGRLVEFRKQPVAELSWELAGESVGFFRFEPRMAARLARRTEQYVAGGRRGEPYEEAIRDLLLAAPDEFGFEDITGLPWIEIDFPGDLTRARESILPRIEE